MGEDSKVEIKDPKVTIIIPTYNYGRFLGEAIQSVLDQTFQDWELIVVDDGSTDGTSEVVASFKDARIRYIYQKNQGPYAARNRGIELARGEYVAFLDADDLWLPMKLEKQVAQLDSLPPTVGLVYTNLYDVDPEDGTTLGRRFERRVPIRGSVFVQLLLVRGFIMPSAVVVRREVFQQVGLFDESLKASGDYEMWVRIASAYEIEVLNEPLAKYRREHTNSIQSDSKSSYYNAVASRLKVLERYPLRPKDRRALLHRIADLHYGYAPIQLQTGNRKEGLRALLTSLRLHPTALWRYPGAAVMLVSPRLYGWLRAGKRRLFKHRATIHSGTMTKNEL